MGRWPVRPGRPRFRRPRLRRPRFRRLLTVAARRVPRHPRATFPRAACCSAAPARLPAAARVGPGCARQQLAALQPLSDRAAPRGAAAFLTCPSGCGATLQVRRAPFWEDVLRQRLRAFRTHHPMGTCTALCHQGLGPRAGSRWLLRVRSTTAAGKLIQTTHKRMSPTGAQGSYRATTILGAPLGLMMRGATRPEERPSPGLGSAQARACPDPGDGGHPQILLTLDTASACRLAQARWPPPSPLQTSMEDLAIRNSGL